MENKTLKKFGLAALCAALLVSFIAASSPKASAAESYASGVAFIQPHNKLAFGAGYLGTITGIGTGTIGVFTVTPVGFIGYASGANTDIYEALGAKFSVGSLAFTPLIGIDNRNSSIEGGFSVSFSLN
jgi:hypothetical protein